MGRSGPRCAPPCPPDRPVTSLMLPDPKPALTLPSLARSPDLAAEPQAPFGTTAARYFAAHRPHPCAQPACRTSTHSKTSLVGRSQLLSLMLRHFLRAHFSRVSGQGGAAADGVADPHPVQGAHQYAWHMPQQPPVPARSLPYPLYVGWSHPTRIGMLPGPRELRGLVRVEMHVQTVFLNVGRSSRKIAVWVRVCFLNHQNHP